MKLKERLEVCRRQGLAQKVTLYLVAAFRPQLGKLGFGLHTLGDDP